MITLYAPFVGLGLTPRALPQLLDLGQCQYLASFHCLQCSVVKSRLMSIPVVLIAGFSQAARHRVIREALHCVEARQLTSGVFSRGRATRVAWLDHQDSLAQLVPTERQPHQSFVACVCCAGSLVFTTYLARTLRQGPWAGLMISLGARAEPARMVATLSRTPWREYLGPIRLFSVMDASGLSLCEQEEHDLHQIACQQKNDAELVLQPGGSLPKDLFG